MLTFCLNCQTFEDNTQKRRNFRNISRFKTQSKSQNMQKKRMNERNKTNTGRQTERKKHKQEGEGGGHNKLS